MNDTKTLDVSICPLCLSDRVYEMDDGSGLCVSCGKMFDGPVKPSVGYHEFFRLKGLLPKRKEEKGDDAAKLDERQEKIVKETQVLLNKTIENPSAPLPKVLQEVVDQVQKEAAKKKEATPEAKKEEGPAKPSVGRLMLNIASGLVSKTKEKLSGLADSLQKPSEPKPPEAPKRPEAIPAKPAPLPTVPAAVQTPKPVVSSEPVVGSLWVVGPCYACQGKSVRGVVGKVISRFDYERAMGPTKPRKVYVQTSNGQYYFGCGLCARPS